MTLADHYKSFPEVACVYVMRCRETNRAYVGACRNLRKRLCWHRERMESGTAPRKLQAVYDASGADGFTVAVVEVCPIETLRDRERHWIGEMRPELNTHKYATP